MNFRDAALGLKPVVEKMGKPLFEFFAGGPFFPLIQADLTAGVDIPFELCRHCLRETRTYYDRIQLIISKRTPHIQVRGADGGPYTVDYGCFCVQHFSLFLVELHP